VDISYRIHQLVDITEATISQNQGLHSFLYGILSWVWPQV